MGEKEKFKEIIQKIVEKIESFKEKILSSLNKDNKVEPSKEIQINQKKGGESSTRKKYVRYGIIFFFAYMIMEVFFSDSEDIPKKDSKNIEGKILNTKVEATIKPQINPKIPEMEEEESEIVEIEEEMEEVEPSLEEQQPEIIQVEENVEASSKPEVIKVEPKVITVQPQVEDMIKEKPEKILSQDEIVTISLPPALTYHIAGRGLIYNCKDFHWACVDKSSYLDCDKHYLWSVKNNEKVGCVTQNIYSNFEDCKILQIYYINTKRKVLKCD